MAFTKEFIFHYTSNTISMIKWVGIFFIFCIWFRPALADSLQLRIITCNTFLVCIGPHCIFREAPLVEKRKERIAEWIKKQSADVIFLQEIWKPEQFEYFRTNAGYPYAVYFGKSSDLAILSRHPLNRPRFVPNRWQGSYEEDCKKGVVGYRYGLGTAHMDFDGQDILLADVHAMPRRMEISGFGEKSDMLTPERMAMLLEYREILKEDLEKSPVIMAGDFNMTPESDEAAFFAKAFGLGGKMQKADKDALCTYCAANYLNNLLGSAGEGVIDYIFASKHFSVRKYEILHPKTDLSDHQPVEAFLELNGLKRHPMPDFSDNDIKYLTDYFENVGLSPYCRLSPELGWGQKNKILDFLRSIGKSF